MKLFIQLICQRYSNEENLETVKILCKLKPVMKELIEKLFKETPREKILEKLTNNDINLMKKAVKPNCYN